MSKPTNQIPSDRLESYDKLIAGFTNIERKGKTTPYTSLNGHMFSFLSKEGSMGMRLSADDRDAFIEQYKTALMEQHGRIMKEFVEVPSELLADTKELGTWLTKSYEYTGSLKPKPTNK